MICVCHRQHRRKTKPSFTRESQTSKFVVPMGAMRQCPSQAASLAAISLVLFMALVPATFTSSLRITAAGELRRYQLLLPAPAAGPESIAFDDSGGGPYTGVSDGRILRWRPETRRWEEFAVPQRPHDRWAWCNGPYSSLVESVCGRPLGLQFHRATGDLYIADAYFGLLVAERGGGAAVQVVTAAEGEPFRFTNGLDIDQEDGVVYFTDSSTHFQRRNYLLAVLAGDATGRLLSYDPKTRELAVLLRGLAFPNGVAISGDGAFLLVAETTNCRVLRYWLRGPRSGAVDVFAELPGYPDNVKRSPRGEFWVALNLGKYLHGPAGAEAQPPVKCPVAARLAGDGRLVEVLEDCGGVGAVSEVGERNGTLWLGSVVRPFVEVYSV